MRRLRKRTSRRARPSKGRARSKWSTTSRAVRLLRGNGGGVMSSRTWTIAALACCAACGQDAGSSQSDGKRSAITTPAGTSHRIDVTVEGPRGVPVFSIPRGIHCAAPGSGPTYGGATDRCSADFPVGTRVILEMDIGTFGIAGTVEGCTGMSDPQRCEVDTDLNTHVTFRLHP